LRPPDVIDRYEDCDIWVQHLIIAYGQIREIEENDRSNEIVNAMGKMLGMMT
jgi:hypothetical protein